MVSLRFLIIFSLAVAAVHLFSVVNDWYFIHRWLDIPMHFAGGFWLAVFLFWFFDKIDDSYIKKSPRWISLVLTLGFVSLAGVFWEFSEFLYDFFIATNGYVRHFAQNGVADTISDLFFDILGGSVSWIWVRRFLPDRER
ncbi:MAG: hypothetical protein HY456_01965 [Parcubacteria group bacterium]|nr:hypothetical protein [Parcubacteria group bacterium]